jgi:hypothetical protein
LQWKLGFSQREFRVRYCWRGSTVIRFCENYFVFLMPSQLANTGMCYGKNQTHWYFHCTQYTNEIFKHE